MVTGLLVASPQRTATVKDRRNSACSLQTLPGDRCRNCSVGAGDVLRLDPFKPNPDPGAVA